MRPTRDTALQRPDLGQIAYEAMINAPQFGFIAPLVMPVFYVGTQAAEYPVIPKESLFNLLDTARGPLGHYNRSADSFESGYYKTAENGLERRVDDRYQAMYASLFDYEAAISMMLMNDILRAWEYRVAVKLMNETNFETAIAAGTAWSTIASAAPLTDVNAGITDLRGKGIVADTLIIDWTNYQYLRNNAAIRSALGTIFPDVRLTGNVTVEHLRSYFDLPKVIVAGALYNSAKRGQDASLASIWGSTYAMVCKTASVGDDITTPCVGRTFVWNEGAQQEVIVEEYYNNEVRSNMLRVRHDTAEAFLSSYDSDNAVKSNISLAAGYLIDATGN